MLSGVNLPAMHHELDVDRRRIDDDVVRQLLELDCVVANVVFGEPLEGGFGQLDTATRIQNDEVCLVKFVYLVDNGFPGCRCHAVVDCEATLNSESFVDVDADDFWSHVFLVFKKQ